MINIQKRTFPGCRAHHTSHHDHIAISTSLQQDTEDALIRLAIAESLLENANKISDQEAGKLNYKELSLFLTTTEFPCSLHRHNY